MKKETENGLALQFGTEKLTNDSRVVKAAVIQNGLALKFASNQLLANKPFMLKAIQEHGLTRVTLYL